MNQSLPVYSLFLTCLAAPVFAHHSSAVYDMGSSVTIEGIVNKYAWANPHVYIHLEQTTAEGETIMWAVEGLPPAAMRRLGWTEQTLQASDRVTVTGKPTRRTRNRGIFPDTIQVGDRMLFQRDTNLERLSTTEAPQTSTADSLAGTWETLANVDLYLQFYTSALSLTPAGATARDSYDEATMLPSLNCIPYSSPLLMIDPDFKRIVVTEEVIRISGGFAPAERTIHMELTTHEGAQPSLQGHSIGHWDGDTLVIDTRHFAEHRIGNGYRGVRSGAQKHLVERLRLQDGGKRLLYSFELEDPEFLAEPVTGSTEWAYRADIDFVREPCALENAQEFRNE